MAIELAKLEAWLTEAEDALHQLMMGKRAVTLNHTLVGSNAVTFQQTDSDKLERYIVSLGDKITRARGRRGRTSFWIS